MDPNAARARATSVRRAGLCSRYLPSDCRVKPAAHATGIKRQPKSVTRLFSRLRCVLSSPGGGFFVRQSALFVSHLRRMQNVPVEAFNSLKFVHQLRHETIKMTPTLADILVLLLLSIPPLLANLGGKSSLCKTSCPNQPPGSQVDRCVSGSYVTNCFSSSANTAKRIQCHVPPTCPTRSVSRSA